VRGLAERAIQQGVQVLPFAEVFDFETSGRHITKVKTTKGDFAPKQIVLSAGSWTPEIIRNLGIRVPIQAAKGYSYTFKKPSRWPALPFSLGEAGVAVTSMGDTLRISGTFAIVGLDLSWDRTRMRRMLDDVPSYLPDLEPKKLELLEVWRGLRPCSPDGLPFLGRSRSYENLIVAAGHSMIGVSLGPVTGKLVSELASHQRPSIDLTGLQVERFD
jgi:D-amino-acid dehydrogenase